MCGSWSTEVAEKRFFVRSVRMNVGAKSIEPVLWTFGFPR